MIVHLTTVDMSLALLLLPQLVAFRDAGYEVVGVSAPGPYVDELTKRGIGHVPLRHSTRSAAPRSDLAAAREFFTVCRHLRPAIVHTHNPKPGIYGRIGARAARVPVVVNTVHGLYAQPTDRLLRRTAVYAMERLASACSDAELVQNPEDIPILHKLRIPDEKIHLLGNGVDLDRFDPPATDTVRREVHKELRIDRDEVVVGLVGRLVVEKGYRDVFAAARRLRDHEPRIRFLVVGPRDDDKADAIADSEIRSAEKDARITFLGERRDVERLYPAMDLYVLASYREGFPRSAMEAAAMGLPVIATNIRGCRQVVEHGRTGLLVPPHDTTGLADAISTLACDPARRGEMGAAARARAVQEFDDRQQVATTLEVYQRLLSRRARQHPV